MKVVLDTSVVVSAVRSRHGASNRLLQMAHARAFRILATPALFLEYEEVLARPEHCAVHAMDAQRMAAFLSGLASLVEPVKVYYQWRPQLQDADDEMVLETALNGFADVIVTHNVRDFEDVASRFGLRVLSPGSLVKELMR
jgi:putative PIN family toxin of toxin-antitoxin system